MTQPADPREEAETGELFKAACQAFEQELAHILASPVMTREPARPHIGGMAEMAARLAGGP